MVAREKRMPEKLLAYWNNVDWYHDSGVKIQCLLVYLQSVIVVDYTVQ